MKSHSNFFLIGGLDGRSLSLFRILLGAALIIDLLVYKLPYFKTFFSGNAIIDSSLIREMSSTYSCSLLYFFGSGTIASIMIFTLAFIIYVLFLIGYKPRIMAVLAFILLFSIHQRNIYFLIGGSDDILRLSLFWSIFLPLGNYFTPFKKNYLKSQNNTEIRNIAAFTFIAQIGFIYFFNSISKNGETWQTGSAVSYSLMIVYMKNISAHWLLTHPGLCELLTYLVKYGSLLIIFFLFSPVKNNACRISATVLIFIFHWGMLPFLNIHHFCLSTLPIIGVLLPSTVWNKFLKKKPQKEERIQQPIYEKHSKKMLWLNLFASISFLFIVLINIDHLSQKKSRFVTFLKRNVCNCYGLNQGWSMFAPDPPKESGIIYTVGVGDDGTFINMDTNTEYKHERAVSEIAEKTNILPLPLVTLHIIGQSISNEMRFGNIFWENWIEVKLRNYKNFPSSRKIKRVLVLYVFVFATSPGKYSEPAARPIFKKDIY